MQDGLRELTSRNSVCTKTLRTLTGIWIWGAQLRRELLSIPHALFRFLDRFPEKIVAWWPSVRREVQAMATAIAAMAADVGAPLAQIVFASDAQGAGEGDDGGRDEDREGEASGRVWVGHGGIVPAIPR